MANKEFTTVKEYLFWSYANLAMAHTAVANKQQQYKTVNYMIRAKLFKGLMTGKMNIRTLFDDEKIKLCTGYQCSYCGSAQSLTLDHMFSKKMGGQDTSDNLVFACRACNSSKGSKDLMDWMAVKNAFPPLMILRRYLKLAINYCVENDLMDTAVEEIKHPPLPFSINQIPLKYPKPSELTLTASNIQTPR